MHKTIMIITILWVINEIFQATEVLQDYLILKYLVFHLSSLYGAIVFCGLIFYLKFNKLLYFTPLAIELFKSWTTCHCIDGWDLAFSMAGILLFYILIGKPNYFEPRGSSIFWRMIFK